MLTEPTQTIIRRMLTTTPPALSGEQAADIALRYFGIQASTSPLVSEKDQNFRLDTENGQRFVLKVSNQAEQYEVVDFQNQALLHIARQDAELSVPQVIPTLSGALHCDVEFDTHRHFVRVLSWVDGTVLKNALVTGELLNRLGRLLARLGLALAGFDHPGSNPPSLWDMKRAGGLRELLKHIQDPSLKRLIGQTLDRFDTRISPLLGDLRSQVIYSDMNLDNVLMDKEQPDRISGLIDFGDMVRSPLIMDLAIASAYQLTDAEDPLDGALPMIAGYHAICPLMEIEQHILPDLIKTRLVTSLLIGSYRAKLFPENREYLLTSFEPAQNALVALSGQDQATARRRITDACDKTAPQSR